VLSLGILGFWFFWGSSGVSMGVVRFWRDSGVQGGDLGGFGIVGGSGVLCGALCGVLGFRGGGGGALGFCDMCLMSESHNFLSLS
jgi:hypothetical protein